MAGLRDLLNKGKDHDSEARKIASALKKEAPYVAEILGGTPAVDGENAISPGTITFFIHEGKARFSASVKSQEISFIGDVADLANPWGSVNTALAMGDVSRKRHTERNGSLSAEQKSLIL